MSKEALKIVTIGGGSSYTPELIEGYILRKDELPIKEIWLVDIEAGKEKLEIVGAMAKRQVEAAGLDWEVHLTLDRFNALKDADFVTTQFRVGLLNARIKDERIPLSHGVLGQETNGAGGMFKAFRTIPIIGQIIAIDLVFSLDSIITAVGMAQQIGIMIAAVVLAVFAMMAFSGAVSTFIEKHPTIKMLALSFLLMIGIMLVADGLGHHIERGYIYFAMAFSLFVEMLNIRVRRLHTGGH